MLFPSVNKIVNGVTFLCLFYTPSTGLNVKAKDKKAGKNWLFPVNEMQKDAQRMGRTGSQTS